MPFDSAALRSGRTVSGVRRESDARMRRANALRMAAPHFTLAAVRPAASTRLQLHPMHQVSGTQEAPVGMGQAALVPALGGARAWRVWGIAAGAYLLAVFHRASLSVAGLAAAERFHIDAAQLAGFTVLQLVVYALMQVPVGVLLDRYGPRRLLTIGLVLMSAGQLGFAFAGGYPLALFTRALVGLGDAMTFLSVLRLVAAWFPPARNALLTQFTAIAGQLGAMASAIPMVWALHRLAWTTTYAGAALASFVFAGALYALVRDAPVRTHAATPPALRTLLAGVRHCWAQPGTRLGAWIYASSLFFPSLLTLLWGYPLLVDGEGASPALAASLLTLLTLASIAGGPLVGVAIGRHARWRLPLASGGLVTAMLTWTALLLWPSPAPRALLAVLMVVAGVGFPIGLVAFDFARIGTPPQRIGTSMALVNAAGYFATIVVVLGIGLLLNLQTPTGQAHYRPEAFRWAGLMPYPVWALAIAGMRRHAHAAR